MTMIEPDLLQFVGIVGLVVLLAGSIHAKHWLGVVSAVACLLSVVSADVLVLPVHWSWIPVAAFMVFALAGGFYLYLQFQQRLTVQQ